MKFYLVFMNIPTYLHKIHTIKENKNTEVIT